MTSLEIDKYIKDHAYEVDIHDLGDIIRNSPQVYRWTFDCECWCYTVNTNDGYSWKVHVYDKQR